MKTFWHILYDFIIIPFLYIAIVIAGLFNSKVQKGLKGRKRIFEELILNAASLDKTRKLIWFHSSSLGEFEQAKPIIEELKKDKINILVTFFSPSGYENSKKYPLADIVSYIPLDTKYNADKFIRIVNPDLAVLMRYDIWPNHIRALQENNIKSLLVDATMKDGSPRKLPLIKQFHKILFKDLTKILTVSEEDRTGFKEFDLSDENVVAVGDTRFDRVYQRSRTARELKLIKDSIINGKKILVAGSTWEQDEEVLLTPFIKAANRDPDLMLIIAPHEPTIPHLEKLENEFRGNLTTIRFSHLNNYKNERVIIVDSIGILMTLYTYADAAFIGGSFKQNVHNVLEAAVYGIPVIFGPKIYNSQEAINLALLGGGIIVRNQKNMYRTLRTLFTDDALIRYKGKTSFDFVNSNLGATQTILKEIYSYL
jgi:3-deoxy-D-manno-octulosonic-acid transferase